jgi:hypothetical protein
MNGLVALRANTAYQNPVALRLAVILALALAASRPAAAAEPPPEAVLLTMGPGDELYARFGHAALLLRWPGSGPDVVFNYGYAEFDNPGMVWAFLRGRARFWVARASLDTTLDEYRRQDRTVYYQRLGLSIARRRELARLLEHQSRPENRYYVYHHFHDNCSTRLRDLLDRVTGGALARRLKGHPGPEDTLRQLVRRGFAGRLVLLLAVDTLLGRTLDRRLDRWEAAFLPRELRRDTTEIALAAGPLAGEVLQLYERKGGDPLASDPLAAVKLLWLVAGLALLLGLAMILLARRRSRWAGLPLLVLSLASGLVGLLVWGVVVLASLPELRLNEIALLLWPTDLALVWPGVRWLAGRPWGGRLLRGYATARLSVVALAAVGHLVGLLVQRPLTWLLLALALAGGLWLAARALPRELPGAEGAR